MSMERECVNGTGQFSCQHRVYHAVTIDPALPFEGLRHDIDPEMGFAVGSVACVSFMQMGFVDDIEAFRRESITQLFCDLIFCGHDLRNIARYSFRSMTVSIAIHHRSDV
jgi:hypothetical protein